MGYIRRGYREVREGWAKYGGAGRLEGRLHQKECEMVKKGGEGEDMKGIYVL